MAAGSNSLSPPVKEIVSQLSNPHQLEALLLQLTTPDTQVVAQGEVIIKKYLKGPVCIGGLMQQVS